MKRFAITALVLAGCVDGLAPAELGVGRRVGLYPGDIPVVLPPIADELGNLFVATGQPDSTGLPQPGMAHSGGARGGWSQGCETGTGRDGGARGWIGARNGRAWLWTGQAIVELDVATGTCTQKLDFDPVSASDVTVLAAAPLVEYTVSGKFALAIIATGAVPEPHLVTLDLDRGLVRSSAPLGSVEVLAVGADSDAEQAAFLVRDATGARVILARPHTGIAATIPVTGALPTAQLLGEIGFGSDGSVAATLDATKLAVGSRSGLAVVPAPFAVRAFERDGDGRLWLTGSDTAGPKLAPLAAGTMGGPVVWTCAITVDQALATGVIVIDERGGERTAARWQAHGVYGGSALLPTRSPPPYAVDARALLIADPPVDRGGIHYSQLAVVPVGMVLQ